MCQMSGCERDFWHGRAAPTIVCRNGSPTATVREARLDLQCGVIPLSFGCHVSIITDS